MLQVWRKHLAAHGMNALCDCEFLPGRFRKSQRVGGCGRPRCWLYHYDKLAGCPTVRDRRDDARVADDLVNLVT